MSTELEKKNWWLKYVDIPAAAFFVGQVAYGVLQKTEGAVKKKIAKDIDTAIQSECNGLGARNRSELIEGALKAYREKTLGTSLASRVLKRDFHWKDAPVLLAAAITTLTWALEDPYDLVGEKGVVGLIAGAKVFFGHKIFSYEAPGRGSLNGALSWWNNQYTDALNDTLGRGTRLQTVKDEKGREKVNQEGKSELTKKRRTFVANKGDLSETLASNEKRRWLPGGKSLVTTEATVPEIGPRKNAYGAIECLSESPPSETGGAVAVQSPATVSSPVAQQPAVAVDSAADETILAHQTTPNLTPTPLAAPNLSDADADRILKERTWGQKVASGFDPVVTFFKSLTYMVGLATPTAPAVGQFAPVKVNVPNSLRIGVPIAKPAFGLSR